MRSFSQDDLIGVLYTTVGWHTTSGYTWIDVDKVASFVDTHADTVRNITWHYRPLFSSRDAESIIKPCDSHFDQFLLDQHRAKGFHVPVNALDIIYLRILSRPPPLDVSWTFSQDDLIAVLHIAVDSMCISTEGPPITEVDFETVLKVTSGPQSCLFKTSPKLSLFDDSLAKFLLSLPRSGPLCHPLWEQRELRPKEGQGQGPTQGSGRRRVAFRSALRNLFRR